MMKELVVVVILLLQCACCVDSSRHRKIDRGFDGVVSSSGFIVQPTSQHWPQQDLNLKSSSSCKETYGFFPCSPSTLGNLFLLAAYGYAIFLSKSFLTEGCELLLVVIGAGIVGGLVLPILGSLSDVVLILVSGLSESKETAQSQVVIGMGLLAGSIVMLLTALWGACLIVGKSDISTQSSAAIDSNDTKGFDLCGSGITLDKETSTDSKIMVLSVIPFIIVQLAQKYLEKQIAVFIGCITAIIFLLSYCIYQILHPLIQKRRIAYAKHNHIIALILKLVEEKGYGRLLRENGEPNQEVLSGIFDKLDDDRDGYLSKHELRGLILGLELQDPQSTTTDNAVDKVMAEFDSSRDVQLSREEFTMGITSWLRIATSTVGHSDNYSKEFMSNFHSRTREEIDALEVHNEEEVVVVENPPKLYLKAVMLMLGGTILAGIFGVPFVDAVDNFSNATTIPSFYISFILLPLALNSSECVSAFNFASLKKKRSASLTYSQIYSAVTIYNTLCLAVFLAIVWIRGLEWDFTAELLVIMLVLVVMGVLSSFRTTFLLWMSFIAFTLYPLSLAIVYVLDYVLGWS